jgi:hypothetical protein
VFLRPAVFDSGAIEYASQLEQVLRSAGFDTAFEDMQNLSSDATIAYDFTGERLVVAPKPPLHALLIQKCFRVIGRTMPAVTNWSGHSNTVVIAVGGRP